MSGVGTRRGVWLLRDERLTAAGGRGSIAKKGACTWTGCCESSSSDVPRRGEGTCSGAESKRKLATSCSSSADGVTTISGAMLR